MVVPKGQGENAVYDYMHQNKRRLNGMQALYGCKRFLNPITYQELLQITEIWVNTTKQKTKKKHKKKKKLVRSQMKRQHALQAHEVAVESHMGFALVVFFAVCGFFCFFLSFFFFVFF